MDGQQSPLFSEPSDHSEGQEGQFGRNEGQKGQSDRNEGPKGQSDRDEGQPDRANDRRLS